MILPIIFYPNKILRQKSASIRSQDILKKETQDFLANLKITMLEKDGIGLAAIQVGQLRRVFVVATEDGPLAFINPKIIKRSWRKEINQEGCLSIPEVFGNVKRSKSVLIKATDEKGKNFTIHAHGILARVIQHEYDHLRGTLFIDRTTEIIKGEDKLNEIREKNG